MIKQTTEKPYRKTTADWIVFENGAERVEKVQVEYYSLTVKQLKEQRDKIVERHKGDPEAIVWLSDLLFPRLHALPDFVDEQEQPVKLTLDWLEEQDVRNLNNLKDAIDADETPKVGKPESV